MAPKMAEIKSGILAHLYALYDAEGLEAVTTQRDLQAAMPTAPKGTIEGALYWFRERGLVDFVHVDDGIMDLNLTAEGVESFEDPQSEIAPFVQNIQHVTINAQQMQNTQLGSGNTIHATYTTVLQQLAKKIEASDVEPAKKAEWLKTVDEIIAHPLTQTALTLVGTAVLQQPR